MTKRIFKGSIKSKLLPFISILLIAGVLGSVAAIFSRDKAPDEESSLESSYGGGFIGDLVAPYKPSYATAEGVLTYNEYHYGNYINPVTGFDIADSDYNTRIIQGDRKLELNIGHYAMFGFSPLCLDETGYGVFETDINFLRCDYPGNRWAFKMYLIGSNGSTEEKSIYWTDDGKDDIYSVGDSSIENEYLCSYNTTYSLQVRTSNDGYEVRLNGICIYSDTTNIGVLEEVRFSFRSNTYVGPLTLQFDNTYCNNIVAE